MTPQVQSGADKVVTQQCQRSTPETVVPIWSHSGSLHATARIPIAGLPPTTDDNTTNHSNTTTKSNTTINVRAQQSSSGFSATYSPPRGSQSSSRQPKSIHLEPTQSTS